jgi:hypothetical protein
MQNSTLEKSQNSTLERALLVVVLMVAALVILVFLFLTAEVVWSSLFPAVSDGELI